MALTGLEIYKLLPKTNCKKCGFPTCLSFAMALAAKKVSLDKCPYISLETKKIIAEASEPPIRTITIDNKYKIGGETVLFRHERSFYNPCLLGVLIKDTFDDKIISINIEKFYKLEFVRIGERYKTELLLLKSEQDNIDRINDILKQIKPDTTLGFICENPDVLEELTKIRRLSLIGIVKDKRNIEKFVLLAKSNNVPLIVGGETLKEIIEIINLIVQQYEYRELIINIPIRSYIQTIEYLTQIRRLAIKKNFRPLGYPTILLIEQKQEEELLAYATAGILKYGSIVVVDRVEPDIHLSLITLRLNIYTDPQKPTTVEPKLYKIGGETTEKSPLLVTTNFSLTYYSVEPEILNSKIPSWLLIVDTDGLSVLTAWAAEKFNAEKIVDSIRKCNIEEKINHRKLIIPGYVAIMSEKLSNLLPGWQIIVGPKEASLIPKFLKSIWDFNN